MSVALCLLAATLTARATTTAPARHPSPHESYETVTLGNGILAFIAPEGRTGTVQGNSVAVIGDDGVLVVDTGQFPVLALSADDKEYLQRQADEIDAFMAQLPDAAHTPADVTFERDLRVHLGQREVQILHLGRGNTGGDTVVYVPDAKIVMAGDMVVYPTPYSFGSWLREWTQTLGKPIKRPAARRWRSSAEAPWRSGSRWCSVRP